MFKILYVLLLIIISSISLAVQEEQIVLEEENTRSENLSSDDNFIHNKNYATIQILNKITAKIKYLNIKIGAEALFDSLKIKALSCWKASPYDLSENKILLDISAKKVDTEEYQDIFKGWMFSSSPAISSLEHPIYDIVAINCYD